jgi:hypothetical protein
LILGEPTGITGKYRFDRNAVDGGLAFSFNEFFLVYGDYLWNFPRAFGASSKFVSELEPYAGVGAILFASTVGGVKNRSYFGTNSSSIGLGFRIPVGIEWLPAEAPLGVFVELVPGIGLVPGTFGFFEGGIGARYYFQ